MAQSTQHEKVYMLDYTYNEQDRSDLTVLINDVRFHIVVDPKDLQKSSDTPLYYEYLDKISALQEAEEREELLSKKTKERVQSQTTSSKQGYSSDSGVDVTADNNDKEDYKKEGELSESDGESGEDADQDSISAGVELRNWILSAFEGVAAECAPPNREPIESTIYEWYHGPTYFYQIIIKSGELKPELIKSSSNLDARIESLTPRLRLPKKAQRYNLPWIPANDLIVQSEVALPEPAHPGRVADKNTGDIYFFKPVVPTEPGTVEREIQILRQIEQLDLDIKVPRLCGFVSLENNKTEAMGFLLSNIEGPKPLTQLLKKSVSKEKRKSWSKKAESYVKLLHDNNIIWGDAKADNFIVDDQDELWIIDFGGSYTDGWVDPELQETEEGDNMGLEKVQKALEDPERNTFDPDDKTADAAGGTGNTRISTDGSVRETASSLFVTEKRTDHDAKRKRKSDEEKEDGDTKRKRKDANQEE